MDECYGAVFPRLATASPIVEAERAGEPEAQATLVAAAKLNEPRVREALELIACARTSVKEGSVALADEQMRAAHFAIAALLPPANIRISTRLASAISESGRRKAA